MKKIIRTKKEVVLNSRTSERGVVSVSFEKLILSEKSLDFTIDVVDYKSIFEPIADIDGNGNVIETEKEFLKLIEKKEVVITNEQAIELEQLAISMGLYEKSGNTTDDLYNLIIVAIFLTVTTDGGENDTLIYDTLAEDWEIVNTDIQNVRQ